MNDNNNFTVMLSCAEEITHLHKQAEMYRALARISFHNDFETNLNFYKLIKNMIASSDSSVSDILLETMKILAVKTIRIVNSFKSHPELLLDLYEYDGVAGKDASEKIAIYLCSKYGSDCFNTIEQIHDITLRSYAYLTALSIEISDIIKNKEILIFIVPHLYDIINSNEFEYLDEDLKNKIHKAYEDLPDIGKTLMTSGEMCIFYKHDQLARSESTYIKIDANNTMTDWKFIENSDGDIVRKCASTDPQADQLYLPSIAKLPDFFFNSNIAVGRWEMAPNGTDCDFSEETHNVYLCYNAGILMRSQERTEQIVKADEMKLVDNNSRRKLQCRA